MKQAEIDSTHRIFAHSPHSPTHPVEPERHPPAADDAEPNTTQLPVEPEFGQALPPAEPEDPTVHRPTI